jgi:hypothetical protein
VDFDYLYNRARKRTSTSVDFDALVLDSRERNAALVSDWRRRFPGAAVAVLEIVVPASGHTKKRLRRYREFQAAKHGTPGVLILRELTSFDGILDLKIVEYRAAAARADVHEMEWRLLSVTEALAEPAP